MLGRMAAAVAALVLRSNAADDGHIGNLVRRVDLVDPDAVGIALKVHADREVTRDGHHRHAVAAGVDGHCHDRVSQEWRVVLITATTEQKNVYLLPVLQLVGDRARRGLDRLHDLADRIDVVTGCGRDEVIEPLVRESGRDDDDQQ